MSSIPPPTAPAPFTYFTLFPRFPVEIRLRIWSLAEPAPRTIIQPNSQNLKSETQGIPSVLHACQESRYEYLADKKGEISRDHAIYTLIFAHTSKPAYFSFEIDTLYLLSEDPSNQPLHPLIHRLILDIEVLPTPQLPAEAAISHALGFPCLQELTFLQSPPPATAAVTWEMLDVEPHRASPYANSQYMAAMKLFRKRKDGPEWWSEWWKEYKMKVRGEAMDRIQVRNKEWFLRENVKSD